MYSSHYGYEVYDVGASVQTLSAHFPPVPALHLPFNPYNELQEVPSSVKEYDEQLDNVATHPFPVVLQNY